MKVEGPVLGSGSVETERGPHDVLGGRTRDDKNCFVSFTRKFFFFFTYKLVQ